MLVVRSSNTPAFGGRDSTQIGDAMPIIPIADSVPQRVVNIPTYRNDRDGEDTLGCATFLIGIKNAMHCGLQACQATSDEGCVNVIDWI